MKQQKLRKIGNSIGVIIPKEMLEEIKLEVGNNVYLDMQQNTIVINKEATYSPISTQFLKVAEDISKKYSAAFKELSSK